MHCECCCDRQVCEWGCGLRSGAGGGARASKCHAATDGQGKSWEGGLRAGDVPWRGAARKVKPQAEWRWQVAFGGEYTLHHLTEANPLLFSFVCAWAVICRGNICSSRLVKGLRRGAFRFFH